MLTSFLGTKSEGVHLSESLQLPLKQEHACGQTLLLQCEVMFGSPSSNCGGNGICKIVARSNGAAETFKRISCGHAKALLAVWDKGHGISLIFRREWLCSNLMRRHFRHGILEMPELCPLPTAIVSALGVDICELPAGLHLIEDYGAHYRVNFFQQDLLGFSLGPRPFLIS